MPALQIGHFTVDMPIAQAVDLGLSPREREILSEVIKGRSVKEIAVDLSVSPHTVDVFKRRIFKKLGVHNAASAAALGIASMMGAPISKTEAETSDTLEA